MGSAREAHSGRGRPRASRHTWGSGTRPPRDPTARALHLCSGTRSDIAPVASSARIRHPVMAALTLTILGAGPAAPNPSGACSGYLLRQGDAAVVMDCGSGVAGRIAEYVPPNRLQGVVISHLHPDHYFDLVPLYYQVRFGGPRPAELGPRLPVYVPPGGREF